jgi:hypothetical protein
MSMSPVSAIVGLVVLSFALILPAIERRHEKRRRLQLLGRVYFDERDSLYRFRRIIGR